MKEKNQKLLLIASGTLTVIAGIIHATIVAFEHVAPLPLETVFFAVTGVLQVGLGILIMLKQRVKFIVSLFILNGMLASAWILTRVFRAPFMNTPEEVSTLGIVVITLEFLAMVMIGMWKWVEKDRIHTVHGYSFTHVISMLLLISLMSGGSVFGGGRLGEVFMPERTLVHSHGHSSNDGHHDDDKNHSDEDKSEGKEMKDMHDDMQKNMDDNDSANPKDDHDDTDDHHDDEVSH